MLHGMSSVIERRIVFYSGRVHGVGFRYTARQIAQQHAVTGWVRNLPDRRVQLVVEGEPWELDRFLAALAERMCDCIHSAQVSREPATGEWSAFEIRA
jgi:acylphosphatase